MMRRLILALALAGRPGQGWVQDIGSEAPTYCSDLQRVTSLAMTRERFASIAGKPREGNFLETRLALSGWTIRLATSGQSVVDSTSEEDYGVIEYSYAGRSDQSRSTSPREILPLIYALAGQPPPTPAAGEEYPGYPLVASASPALAWFFGGLPLLIVLAWWLSSRPPRIAAPFIKDGGQP
jgi:hypothetical protein